MAMTLPAPKRSKLVLWWLLTPVFLLVGVVAATHEAAAARAVAAPASEPNSLPEKFQ